MAAARVWGKRGGSERSEQRGDARAAAARFVDGERGQVAWALRWRTLGLAIGGNGLWFWA